MDVEVSGSEVTDFMNRTLCIGRSIAPFSGRRRRHPKLPMDSEEYVA